MGNQKSANQTLAYILDESMYVNNTFLNGVLGMQDDLRPTARSAIKHTMGTVDIDHPVQYDEKITNPDDEAFYLVPEKERRITVRMVTGDSKATAAKVAIKAGLIQEPKNPDDHNEIVMDA